MLNTNESSVRTLLSPNASSRSKLITPRKGAISKKNMDDDFKKHKKYVKQIKKVKHAKGDKKDAEMK